MILNDENIHSIPSPEPSVKKGKYDSIALTCSASIVIIIFVKDI